MLKGRRITSLAIWSSLSFSEEEIQHVCHVLIVLGFVPTSKGPRRPCQRLKLGLVHRLGHRGLELLGSGPRERTEVLTLLVQVVTIEHLVQPPLPSVISCLLSNHVTHIPIHPELYPIQVIREGPQRWCLLSWRQWRICPWLLILLELLRCPGMQYFLMKALVMGGQMTLLGATGTL